MPAVGEQHKTNSGASANPFEEETPRISEYTAQEIAALQSRLEKRLGPEFISSRPGAAGQKVHYLAAEKVINLANEVFGFNGWSSAIKVITIDFIDENPHNGKISLGLSVTVRVTLRDGTYHEDIGYGHIENCKGKAAAFEKAKKEGTTDGLKRALRTFGNVLGNCIYDKDFLGRVTKIKVAPSRWDADNLHRHPDFAPVKKETAQEDDNTKNTIGNGNASHTEGDDEFGGADFSDADFSESHNCHPDEVVLPADPPLPPPLATTAVNTPARNQRPAEDARPFAPRTNAGMDSPSRQPQTRVSAIPPDHRSHRPTMQRSTSHEQNPLPAQLATNTKADIGAIPTSAPHASSGSHASSPCQLPQHLAAPEPGPGQAVSHNCPPPELQQVPSVGFYSARAASALNGAPKDSTGPVSQFNPHSESPSIRKTSGIDHSRSIPVKRAAMGVAELPAAPAQVSREGMTPVPARDFVNPSSDMHRRIGAPSGGMPSPMSKGGMNGSAYKALTMNRHLENNAGMVHSGAQAQGQRPLGPAGVKRPPLGDVSNMHPSNLSNQAGGVGEGIKRQKTTGPENVGPPQQNLPGAK